MNVSSVRPSGFGPIGAGVRAQLNAVRDQRLLGDAGLLTKELDVGLNMLEKAGKNLVVAGLEAKRSDLIGQFIDELA